MFRQVNIYLEVGVLEQQLMNIGTSLDVLLITEENAHLPMPTLELEQIQQFSHKISKLQNLNPSKCAFSLN